MSDNYIAKEEILSFVEELEKRTHGDDLITKTVLATTKCVKDFVMHMPPAQPEVIRCKDCKHSEHWYRGKRRCFLWHETGIGVFEGGYCNYGKRRTRGEQE